MCLSRAWWGDLACRVFKTIPSLCVWVFSLIMEAVLFGMGFHRIPRGGLIANCEDFD